MKKFDRRIWIAAAGLAAAACAPSPETSATLEPVAAVRPAAVDTVSVDTVAPGVMVRRLAERVWLHVTVEPGAGRYESNGLIIDTGDGSSLLIDTAWDDAQTGVLARWAAERGMPIRRAIPTHFHSDRLGGIDTLRALGVTMTGLDLTRQLAAAKGITAPEVLFTAAARTYAGEGFEAFYPGAGHSRDNIVVWLSRERILFGGCLIKAAETRDMGNTADADVAHWDDAVTAVQARYPQAARVIPGHGSVGGPNVLTHTNALISAFQASTKPGGR